MTAHDVGTHVGTQCVITECLVIHEHELVVQFILLTGYFLVSGLLLRIDGIALILFVNIEVEIDLILEFQLRDNLIAESHITIDAIAVIRLIVHVATPVRVIDVYYGIVVYAGHIP